MSSDQTQATPEQGCTQTCNNHPTEIVKFYCKQHETVGCGDCMSLEHKTCKFDYIPEIAADFIDGAEYRELDARVIKLQNEVTTRKETVKKNIQNAEKAYSNIVSDIRKFRKEIEEYLQKMEQNLLAECQKRKKEDEQLMKELELECNSMEVELTTLQSRSKSYEKQTGDLFVQAMETSVRLKQLEEGMNYFDNRNKVPVHQLQRRRAINGMLSKEIPIGEIVDFQEGQPIYEDRENFRDLVAKRIGEIYVKSPTDMRDCWITGIATLKYDRLACTDTSNKSVKLVDITQRAITHRVSFSNPPWGVAAIYNYQLAVTIPSEKKIEILMLGDGLSKSHSIDVDGTCFGIAHKDRTLYVSYLDPPKVETMYIEGEMWQRYVKDSFGVHMFQTPRQLALGRNDDYEDYICVSDGRRDYVTKLKMDVRRHKDALRDGSNGLVVLKDESLLVCAENHRVYHISPDLTKSRVVLSDIEDGIAYPDALCHNMEDNTLYLSNRKPGYHSNNIFMYKLT